jgi:formylglycine-generating enzyme required for sulfatase activity
MKKHCFIWLFVLGAFRLAAQKPELYVLAVGIEEYADQSFGKLNYCVEDAIAAATAFRNQTNLYDIREVSVLTNGQATRQSIRSEFNRFKDMVTEDDVFVFFFSGHGKENYLVPQDYRSDDPKASSFSKDDLFEALHGLGCNSIVVLDACHSASFARPGPGAKDIRDKKEKQAEDLAISDLMGALKEYDKLNLVLCSSSSDKFSFECEPCGHGYLTQAILDALQGKSIADPMRGNQLHFPDKDQNGYLSIKEFEIYVKESVRIRTAGDNKQDAKSLCLAGRDVPIFHVTGKTPMPTAAPTSDDTDGDGVPDALDRCPQAYGIQANGCPQTVVDTQRIYVEQSAAAPEAKKTEAYKIWLLVGPMLLIGALVSGAALWRFFRRRPADFEETVNGVTFKMIAVEGGTFTMGCTEEQGGECEGWEKPAHQVTLSSFHIGETVVTQGLWRQVMESNPSKFVGCDECPVEMASWNDSQRFIEKLNRLTGKRFRLPTEAEWEFAARGGNCSCGYKYSGSNHIDEIAWYKGNSNAKPQPVKRKRSNELGLYDMSGNVWEFCSDILGPYTMESQINPKGAISGSTRVGRGGSWSDDPHFCRISRRGDGNPDVCFEHLGFRLACDLNG